MKIKFVYLQLKWIYGSTELRNYGDKLRWKYGITEIRRLGTMEYKKIYKKGNTNSRKYGNTDIRDDGIKDLRSDGIKEMNVGGLKEPRLGMFKKLLELIEKYKRVNQWG